MKTLSLLAFSLFLASSRLLAVEGSATANGVEVHAKEKAVNNSYNGGGVDRTITVNVMVKNVSFKDLPEGDVEYSLIVERSHRIPPRVILTGTGKLPAMKTAQTVQFQAGVATFTEGHGSVKFYFKIVVKHNGKDTVTVVSNPLFNSLAATSTKADEYHGLLAEKFEVVTDAKR